MSWDRIKDELLLEYDTEVRQLEADEAFIALDDENNRYLQKVAGISGFFLWTTLRFDISFDAVGATSSYHELSDEQDKPFAWNLEFVHFLSPNFQWALRMEGSQEIVDEPEQRIGAALTWRTGASMSIWLEYLHGRYRYELVEDGEGGAYDHLNHIGALLSIAF